MGFNSGFKGLSNSSKPYQLELLAGTQMKSERVWLRHCATSRKFAGSIADGVI